MRASVSLCLIMMYLSFLKVTWPLFLIDYYNRELWRQFEKLPMQLCLLQRCWLHSKSLLKIHITMSLLCLAGTKPFWNSILDIFLVLDWGKFCEPLSCNKAQSLTSNSLKCRTRLFYQVPQHKQMGKLIGRVWFVVEEWSSRNLQLLHGAYAGVIYRT